MPRLVGGSAGGRHIKAPPGGGVRPATARARKSLFDYLAQVTPGARTLDLYCGSGGLGLEALSRGAAGAWFVDSGRHSIETVRDNAARLGFADCCHYARRDVFAFLHGLAEQGAPQFDLIFAAPPYRIAEPARILEAIAAAAAAAPGASVCLEFSRHTPSPHSQDFRLDRRREYGETVIEVWDRLAARGEAAPDAASSAAETPSGAQL